MAKNPSVILYTPDFVLSYPALVTPEAYKEPGSQTPKGDPVYNMEMIFAGSDLDKFRFEDEENSEGYVLKDIRAVAAKLAKEKWGDDFNPAEAVKHGGLGWPLKSGDERAAKKPDSSQHLLGKTLIRAKALTAINGRKNSPRLYVAAEDGSVGQPISVVTDQEKEYAESMFYGGAVCSAEISLVANEFANKRYITIYINSVVFEQHGERLGKGSLTERMRGVRGGSSDHDPTKGLNTDLDNDQIPG